MNLTCSFSSLALHGIMKLSNGELVSWGDNTAGSLGLGDTIEREGPEKISFPEEVVAVNCGRHHTLALLKDGSLWSWGDNNSGQLGLGDYERRYSPTRISMPNGVPVTKIASCADGGYAVTEDGSLYAWGDNPDGQLGNGTTERSNLPLKVEALKGKDKRRRGSKREGEGKGKERERVVACRRGKPGREIMGRTGNERAEERGKRRRNVGGNEKRKEQGRKDERKKRMGEGKGEILLTL
jgi:hypothetical protein